MKVEYTIQTTAHPQPTPDGRETYTARVLYQGRTYNVGRSTDPDRVFLSMLADGRLGLHAIGEGDLLDPSRSRSRVVSILDAPPASAPLPLLGSESVVPRSALAFSLGLAALGALYFASRARTVPA